MQRWFIIATTSVSHDPSEIILILYADLVLKKYFFIINAENSCAA